MSDDLEVVNDYSRLITRLIQKDGLKKIMASEKSYTIKCYYLYKYLKKSWGIEAKYSSTMEIPSFMLSAPKEYVIEMLKAYFSCCGGVNKGRGYRITSRHCTILKQIQLILLNLGIVSSIKKKKDSMILDLNRNELSKFYDIVGFCSEHKTEAVLEEIDAIEPFEDNTKNFSDIIVSIEESEGHVYDISMPETHSFVSNGFISHNTWGEVISLFLTAILYPGITLSLTAQTKENAAALLKDKYDEIVKQYPLLKNEMYKPKYAKDKFEVKFINGSRIDSLANAQSSKGQRRNRIQIEESALLDNILFEDALKPIVEIGRQTIGKLGIINPMELNQSINFFTTTGFRGSDEWRRSCIMYKNMMNLTGDFVLGSGWQLGCWMGRGSTKPQIQKKKQEMGAIAFARNYEEKWVGAVDNQLVDINKLLKIRTLTQPVFENYDNSREIVLGVDVARSANDANNKTAISVVEEFHNENGLIKHMDLVNMYLVSNQLDFNTQACLIKKIQQEYNAKIVVVDVNGLGAGLRDELLRPNTDNQDGAIYPAWDAVNGEIHSEYREALPLLYSMNATNRDEINKGGRVNSYAIVNFISCIESQKLRILEERRDNSFDISSKDGLKMYSPFEQTNALVEEIANLKLRRLNNGEVAVEKVLSKIDKDRYSSLLYALWWIMSYDNNLKTNDSDLFLTIAKMNGIGASKGSKSSIMNLFR